MLFQSHVTYVTDGETATVTGPWRSNKRDARGVVALRVLSDLAGLPVEAPFDGGLSPEWCAGCSGAAATCGSPSSCNPCRR